MSVAAAVGRIDQILALQQSFTAATTTPSAASSSAFASMLASAQDSPATSATSAAGYATPSEALSPAGLATAPTSGVSATGAQKILQLAEEAVGGPYSQDQHSAAFTDSPQQMKQTGTDCSGFVSWLMGPDGLGLWQTAYATPGIPSAPGIQQGQGSSITIWNNPLPGNSGHVFIDILGQYFQSAGGGVGIEPISQSDAQQMIASGDDGAPYYPLHPQGF
jgi:hypothetical protein